MAYMADVRSREHILGSRWLRPIAHLLTHPTLWHLNRRSVPRALAVGFFAAFVLPVGQFVLAVVLALTVRANVPLAVAATLITNPLTFAPIYLAAYQSGKLVLGRGQSDTGDFAASLGEKLWNVSGPTAVGLLIFAVSSAVAGYVIGSLWWRFRVARRWRSKRLSE